MAPKKDTKKAAPVEEVVNQNGGGDADETPAVEAAPAAKGGRGRPKKADAKPAETKADGDKKTTRPAATKTKAPVDDEEDEDDAEETSPPEAKKGRGRPKAGGDAKKAAAPAAKPAAAKGGRGRPKKV